MIESISGGGQKWLVTGAAGFIGSNLSAFLLERGERVVGLDNFFSGKRANIDRLNCRFGQGFTFVEGDIRDAEALSGAVAGCRNIAHLAAQVSVVRSIDRPEETHDINTTGFLRVIEAAAAAGAENLIYASSCAVYGDNDALPLSENACPRPMSPYAASKLANEAYAGGFRVLAPELNIVGLRFFNTFGAWQDAGGGYAAVIPKWIGLLLDGKQPVMFGDGSATRDFCHVANVCEAVRLSARHGSSVNGAVLNIAGGVATRLDELYATIIRTLAEAGQYTEFAEPSRQAWRTGEIVHSYGDPRKAAEAIGFNVKIDLKAGLRRMLEDEYGMRVAGARDGHRSETPEGTL